MRPKLTMPICRKCKRSLPREAFDPAYDKMGNPRGLQLRCRECQRKPTLLQKLMARIEIRRDGCWIWTGVVANTGYGHWHVDGRIHGVHRLMYELHHGPIPDGLLVCHRCDVRACCNPAHLFLGTARDNARDCADKGRTVKRPGELHPMAQLTDEQAMEIRRRSTGRYGENAELAREYGVTRETIRNVITRRTFSHLP